MVPTPAGSDRRRPMAEIVNLFSHQPAARSLRDGIKLSFLAPEQLALLESQAKASEGGLIVPDKPKAGLLIGGFIHGNRRKIRGTSLVPMDWTRPPEVKGEYIYQASIYKIEDTGGVLIGARQSPDEAYVLIRTGLAPWNLAGELFQLYARVGGPEKFSERKHGSVAMHGSQAAKLMGVDESELGPDAEVLWKIAGKSDRLGLSVPPYTYALWRLHKNSAILTGDLTGERFALIGTGGGGVRMDDASGLSDDFEELLEQSHKQAA
jgi:hypothetical protein